MSWPQFPEFKPLEIEDQGILTAAISGHPSEACEMHFANIYLWRHFEHPKLTSVNGNLCLYCEPPSEPAYFLQPIGENDVEGTLRTLLSFAPRLSRVDEPFALRYGRAFRCDLDRDNFDYVYRTEDLAELKGKKYDGKRNRIRKFERNYSYSYARLSQEHLPGCRQLLSRWLDAKAGSDGFIGRVWKSVVEEGLAHFDALGLRGGVFEVNGRTVALSMGTKLTPATAVIPIEIVDPGYDGLSQLVNREFIRREWADFRFINREQDNGIPGLRRAKSSYQPHHFVKKYNIST